MQENALDRMLEKYAGNKAEIGITLKDATFLKGTVKSFDGYVILMEGEPGELIYRHSILKLSSPAAARPQPAPAAGRPEAPAMMERKFQRPETAPRRSAPARLRPERQPESKREEKPGHLGTLGEEMMKWLKSQKGNE